MEGMEICTGREHVRHKGNPINQHKAVKYTHPGNVVIAGVVLVLCESPGSSDPLCAHQNNLQEWKGWPFIDRGLGDIFRFPSRFKKENKHLEETNIKKLS